MDLCDQVDWSSVECLNQQPDHAIPNALKQVTQDTYQQPTWLAFSSDMLCTIQGYRDDDGLYLESDTDEQLLMHITFQQGEPIAVGG